MDVFCSLGIAVIGLRTYPKNNYQTPCAVLAQNFEREVAAEDDG